MVKRCSGWWMSFVVPTALGIVFTAGVAGAVECDHLDWNNDGLVDRNDWVTLDPKV